MADTDSNRQSRDVFAGVPAAISRARHLTADRLRAWGLERLVTSLELAVGELVTNAVRHGKEPIELIMALLADRVRVEVHDHGGGQPAIRPVQRTGPDAGGWGLHMVDQLVDAWGTHTTGNHTIVWIERTL
jgi:anti-sigma regulatory factor (Ser/Thr protein kinase)